VNAQAGAPSTSQPRKKRKPRKKRMPRKKRKQAALDAVHDGALGDAHADSSFVVMQREADELVLHIVKWLVTMDSKTEHACRR
jgi:hypothetical protein